MTTINLSYGFIDLEAEIEDTERDCFDPRFGHYTVPDNVQLVAVYHKGVDISEILPSWVEEDIMKAYRHQVDESHLP
jgi:hypothetical protein